MLIAGFQKTSFVDYPGQPCAVVFTPYCNLDCVYCHNAHIIGREAPIIPEEPVLDYLEKRAGLLSAVVISGGEPTLQQNLEAFILRVRTFGYKVKLDTNGTKPQTLLSLLNRELLDYVAMDVKAPAEKYAEIVRANVDVDAIRRSIVVLRNSGIPHEFRLTYAPQLNQEDALETARMVKGCDRFYLQQYRPRSDADPRAHSPADVMLTGEAIAREIGNCTVRGLGPEQ
ncbi:MAG: anaerobic ribonucleoside-triphosphate reductase activating protein [Clostridiales bacterium]|nr:anaerobic ribonucleoside-triphosphate reductase activating protein [Clostridiales bacterium]